MKSYTVDRIKKEALMLCEVNDGEDVGALTNEEMLNSDKYAVYLRGMDASINRCLKRFVEERVLPLHKFSVEYNPEERGNYTEIDVSEYTDENIDCIVSCDLLKNGVGVFPGIRFGYSPDSGTLILPTLSYGYSYTVKYRYVPKEINPFYDNSETIVDVDNKFAALIPYYVFGEVYRQTEPNIASTAGTQYFEERLAQLCETYAETQTTMENIFKGYN